MRAGWRFLVVVLFLAGMLLTGLVGTSTSMVFVWPAYAILGLAGLLSIGLLFEGVSFTLPRWGTLAVFGFALYLLIRAADSPVAYFAREDAALVVAGFLVYCLFLSLLTSADWRQRLVEALALLVAVNLGFALAQTFLSPSLWLIPGYERTFADRAGGLFNQPEHYAAFLAALAPLWIVTALFSRRRRAVRIGAGILATLSLVGVVASGSVAGMLALMAGTAVVAALCALLMKRRISRGVRRKALVAFSGAGLVAALVAFGSADSLGKQIDRGLLTKAGGVSLPQLWKSGTAQIAEAPLIGTGSRTTRIHGRLHRAEPIDASTGEPEFLHNEYLQLVADYGAVGALLLLAMLVFHLRSGHRFVRAYAGFGARPGARLPKSDHLAFVLGALGGLAAIGTVAAFDFVLHLPVFVLLGAIFLAVLAAPDPMGAALKPAPSAHFIPGGSLLFMNRAVVFGCGIATLVFGLVFSRAEYHYEMARLAFETDPAGFRHHRHLREARALDPKNPFVFSLSAHAAVSAILPEMPAPARREALEQADTFFTRAEALYPQDVFAAVGHAAVLEELGRGDKALRRIRDARELAPNYGHLMLAEAEHRLRRGEIAEAEAQFTAAMSAPTFRNAAAAMRGLRIVTEWKLIAEQNGIDWRLEDLDEEAPATLLARPGERSLPEAKVEERATAAAIPASPEGEVEPPAETDKPDSAP